MLYFRRLPTMRGMHRPDRVLTRGKMFMKQILCIGDSNTWGYDPRSYFGSQYPADIRWTGLLEEAGWQVLNGGQNGLSIPGAAILPLMREYIRSKLPVDIITVMLGSNDLLEGATASETADRMEGFLSCIREAAPDASVLLLAPPAMKSGAWVQSKALLEESAALAVCYRELAERMDMEFADAGPWNVELTYDGVHFSPGGHRAFSEGLLKAIGKATEKRG